MDIDSDADRHPKYYYNSYIRRDLRDLGVVMISVSYRSNHFNSKLIDVNICLIRRQRNCCEVSIGKQDRHIHLFVMFGVVWFVVYWFLYEVVDWVTPKFKN